MWMPWAFFFWLRENGRAGEGESGIAGERGRGKKKKNKDYGMWMPWAFFFLLASSPAHRLKTSCSQTKPGICIWKGCGVLLPKCVLWGKALDCYFQKVFFLEGPFF